MVKKDVELVAVDDELYIMLHTLRYVNNNITLMSIEKEKKSFEALAFKTGIKHYYVYPKSAQKSVVWLLQSNPGELK